MQGSEDRQCSTAGEDEGKRETEGEKNSNPFSRSMEISGKNGGGIWRAFRQAAAATVTPNIFSREDSMQVVTMS